MTVSHPESLVDESDIYPIPDTQEIYHNPDTKQSLIVEIVEHVEECDMHGKSPGEFYANDLADMNDASVLHMVVEPTNMVLLSQRPEVDECIYCKGVLDGDMVMHLVVIRIPSKGSDVLISSMHDEFPREIVETFDILDWSLFDG